MSIEKKSLISTLKTTKKANVASSTPSFEATHKMNKFAPKTLASKVVVKKPAKSMVKAATKSLQKKMPQ
jgi:hypothetical protein